MSSEVLRNHSHFQLSSSLTKASFHRSLEPLERTESARQGEMMISIHTALTFLITVFFNLWTGTVLFPMDFYGYFQGIIGLRLILKLDNYYCTLTALSDLLPFIFLSLCTFFPPLFFQAKLFSVLNLFQKYGSHQVLVLKKKPESNSSGDKWGCGLLCLQEFNYAPLCQGKLQQNLHQGSVCRICTFLLYDIEMYKITCPGHKVTWQFAHRLHLGWNLLQCKWVLTWPGTPRGKGGSLRGITSAKNLRKGFWWEDERGRNWII